MIRGFSVLILGALELMEIGCIAERLTSEGIF
jgi:hypothetical protein